MPSQEELEIIAELEARGEIPKEAANPNKAAGQDVSAEEQEVIAELSSRGEIPSEQIDISKDVSQLEALGISVGRGMTNIMRGFGLAEEEPESVKRQLSNLEGRFPGTTMTGEIIGEAAPFLIPGTAVGKIPSLAGRVAAGATVGATEGGVIARGRGEGLQTQLESAGIGGAIGGGAEALFPVIGRLGGALIRKITGKSAKSSILTPDGVPTPEFKSALDKAGMSFDDIAGEAQKVLNQPVGANPEDVARAARFKGLDIPATTGDITQEFQEQALESRLVESSTDPLGDKLRTLRLNQSEGFRRQLASKIQNMGVPDDVGDSIKDALSGRLSTLKTTKNDLYRKVAETSPEIREMPIIADSIIEAVPDAGKIRRISRIKGNQVDAINDLLVEFGISKDPTALDAFIESGGNVIPLNIGNFDEFRIALGQIERADQTGATSVIVAPIRAALDNEAGLIDDALRAGGITDESILAPLKEARATVRKIKTEFSPQSIAGRLTGLKKDGVTPVLEASKVYGELMREAAPIENLQRAVNILKVAGKEGKQAIQNMQAKSIMDLLDEGFKAESRRIEGAKVFGAIPFIKKFEKMEPKLVELFIDSPDDLKQLKTIVSAAKDIVPASGAVQKGSANIILDALNKMGMMSITAKFPPLAGVIEVLRKTSQAGVDRVSVEKALKASPRIKNTVTLMQRELPNLASSLGIAGIMIDEEETK